MGTRAATEDATLAQRLVGDVGGKSPSARQGVAALVESLRVDGPVARAALDGWRSSFRATCGQDWSGASAGLDTLSAAYGVELEPGRPELVLFALQSWYVLVVKLLVGRVIAHVRGVESAIERIASAGSPDLVRAAIEELESGQFFRRVGVADPFADSPFAWYAASWSEAIRGAVTALARRLAPHDPAELLAETARGRDLLKPLYQGMIPRSVRHALGEYYTPDWLAEHVLDQVGYQGDPKTRLLDPSCGSGTFLIAAIRRLRRRLAAGDRVCEACAASIVGLDLHPLAAVTARANYLMALADRLPDSAGDRPKIDLCSREGDSPIFVGQKSGQSPGQKSGQSPGCFSAEPMAAIPVYRCDSILNGPPRGVVGEGFDFVVGNPPWIAWDNLPDEYRQATRPLWEQYGLFSLSGRDARHGGGKKDLAMLMLYAAADRYSKAHGRLGMVVTQTLFQTKGAGDGFRRFRLGAEGDWLGVLRVDDLVAVRPFGDASNWTSTVVLEKGTPTQYPVPYVKWLAACGGEGGSAESAPRQSMLARPIEPERPSSPWLVWPEGWTTDIQRLVGRSDYTAHLGANSGGANGVFWLDVLGPAGDGVRVRNLIARGKGGVAAIETVIEPDLLYPLVRWADVDCYAARASAHLLLVQDVATRRGIDEGLLRQKYPRTHAYLKGFEPFLTRRAAYRRYQNGEAFYSMYNVGPYTLSPAKVIWRRMDRRIRAAVIEMADDPQLGRRSIVPQETCVLVPCESGDEAHYLCALLNSAVVHWLVSAHSVVGGKGFGTPSILDFVPLRRFCGSDGRHVALSAMSREAHAERIRAVGPGVEGPALAEIQGRMDRSSAELFGVSPEELRAAQASG